MLPCLVPVLFSFYLQVVLKFKCKIPAPKCSTACSSSMIAQGSTWLVAQALMNSCKYESTSIVTFYWIMAQPATPTAWVMVQHLVVAHPSWLLSVHRVMLLTYLLTPWSRVLLEKLTGSAASQEIPRIFGTRRFVTVLTSARHLSLSWANSIQSPQPPPTSWRSILILSSHLRLGLPSGLFPSGFSTRTLCTPTPYAPHVPPISFF